MHLRSLRRFPFDAVLLPMNYVLASDRPADSAKAWDRLAGGAERRTRRARVSLRLLFRPVHHSTLIRRGRLKALCFERNVAVHRRLIKSVARRPSGGALEELEAARERGIVRIGVTGHLAAPRMHLRSLRRFPFDAVRCR